VVRLPRDWIGPRDELVPFGPRATGGVVDLDSPAQVTPDDFWGEGSASIHDVLAGPALGGEGVGVVAPAGSRPARWRVAALRGRAGAGLCGRAGASYTRARARVGPLSARGVSVSLPGRRIWAMVAGGLVVLACAAIAVGRFGGGLSDRSHSPVQLNATGLPVAAARAWWPSIGALERDVRLMARRHGVPQRRFVHRVRASARVRRATASAGGGPSGSPPPPVTRASSMPVSSQVDEGPSAGATPAGSSAHQPSGDAAAASAGPQGPGAPFGPGHLG
jgi:hypothetical protein